MRKSPTLLATLAILLPLAGQSQEAATYEVFDVDSESSWLRVMAWPDGATTETVMIPAPDPSARRTVCLSTQVGCDVGCRFCACEMLVEMQSSSTMLGMRVYFFMVLLRNVMSVSLCAEVHCGYNATTAPSSLQLGELVMNGVVSNRNGSWTRHQF